MFAGDDKDALAASAASIIIGQADKPDAKAFCEEFFKTKASPTCW